MAECADCSASAKNAAAGACHLDWSDVEQWNDGLIAILSPDRADVGTEAALARTKRIFADRAYLALTIRRRPKDAIRLRDLANLAAAARVPTVATNDVLYHAAERHAAGCCHLHPGEMHDRRIGRSARAFADRHLKTGQEMERLFRRYLKDASPVSRTLEIAARCGFSLGELRYQYPDEINVPGRTPQEELERLTWEKAPDRYPEGSMTRCARNWCTN
jgi:error-prone DNA polymerase